MLLYHKFHYTTFAAFLSHKFLTSLCHRT